VQVPDGARGDLLEAAREILAARYPGADSLLLAGSIARGEATVTSDLDLVVRDRRRRARPRRRAAVRRSSVRVRYSLAASTS